MKLKTSKKPQKFDTEREIDTKSTIYRFFAMRK